MGTGTKRAPESWRGTAWQNMEIRLEVDNLKPSVPQQVWRTPRTIVSLACKLKLCEQLVSYGVHIHKLEAPSMCNAVKDNKGAREIGSVVLTRDTDV